MEVAANRIDYLRRLPSDLRRYHAFTWKLKQDYGSVTNFLLEKRLGWSLPLEPKGAPFECSDDIKILYNDWPYGVDPRIVHLLVWTKFPLREDPETGDLTAEERVAIDEYVNKTFRTKVPADQVRTIFLSCFCYFPNRTRVFTFLTWSSSLGVVVPQLEQPQVGSNRRAFPCDAL